MRRAVLNLADSRPASRIPVESTNAIVSAFRPGWEVVVVTAPVDGRGDGGGVSHEALAAVRGAEICLSYGMPRELFLAATLGDEAQLRWVHTATAGVASLLYPEMLESNVILTNSAGVHGPAMAETVLAMMLYFARGFDVAVRAQSMKEWDAASFENEAGLAREISGATLGVIGLGGIGREVAWRARALGMNVLATRRRAAEPTDPALNITLLAGEDALFTLLAASDYIVLSVPSTTATRGMIGPREIAAMKPGAVLVNVARGDVIASETALAEALRTGHLRGAALDVFAEEPLPSTSPLWGAPNVLITPHVSGVTPRFWERESALITDNVRRYLEGQPLRNVVDKRGGY